jgi:hypothetical protein
MAAHVTAASVLDFKLFSYFVALFLIFLDIDTSVHVLLKVLVSMRLILSMLLFIHINI